MPREGMGRVVIAVCWFIALGLMTLYCHELNEAMFMMSPMVWLVLLLWGAGIIIDCFIAVLRHRTKWRGIVISVMVAGAMAMGTMTDAITTIGTYSKLWRNEARYTAIVEQVAADPNAAVERDVHIDRGPPVRIAFDWGGLIDNWHGVVHDPTGLVMRINDADHPYHAKAYGLFGGGLARAVHLWGDWYYVVFT